MFSRTLKLSHKALILVAVPLVFEFVFVFSLLAMLDQAENQVIAEVNAKQQLYCFNSMNFCMNSALKALMGAAAIHGPEFVDMFHKALEPVPDQFSRLGQLLKNDPTRLAQLGKLRKVADKLTGKLASILSAGTEDPTGAMLEVQTLKPEILDFFTITSELRKENDRVMHEGAEIQSRQRASLRVLLIAFLGFNMVLAITLALSFNRTTTARLAVLLDNTRRLANGDKLNPPLQGHDEIAHLDQVFNEMAITISDARLKEQAVVLHAQEVICSLDRDGCFTKVNPAAYRVWGYSPEEMLTSALTKYVHEEDQEVTVKSLRNLINETPDLTFENRITGKDGSIIDTFWSAHWSETDRSIFCVAHNITDRKQVERVKQEFYSMVSHDLRTPLTSIYGVLKLVLAGALGPVERNVQDKLGIAVRNLDRLITLINDLLDLEKLESGRMPFEMEYHDAAPIVLQSVQAVEGFAQHKQVVLAVENNYCNRLYCDSGRLIQVLVNLISNAVKFSSKKGTVVVSSLRTEDCVEFRVQDFGRGIPPQYCKAIFERFTQVEARDARRETGTGIGLTVCKYIAEAHGGTIGVESEVGHGSTFWFRVPLKSEQLTPAPPPITEEPGEPRVVEESSMDNVLAVAEDGEATLPLSSETEPLEPQPAVNDSKLTREAEPPRERISIQA